MKFTFGASFALGLFTATGGWHPAQAQTAGFQGLGDLPGGAYFSEVSGLSADGTTVVGWSNSADASPGWHQAFKWSNGVMTALPDVSGGLFRSNAGTASSDGSVIVGDSADANGSQAVFWNSNGQVVSLGALTSIGPMGTARGVSDDATIIVGSCTSASGWEAFRWTQAQGLIGMGDLPGGAYNSAAQTVSQNGTVIFGTATTTPGPTAFRWTLQSGMVALGDLPGGGFFSEPYAATSDGGVMVGRGKSTASGANRFEAFRWTSATSLEGLGDLPGGVFESFALDITDDGQTVVGFGTTTQGQEAFVWTREEGMRRLVDVLPASAAPPPGWTLTAATAISADGLTIAGNGMNPNGDSEAWVCRLPSPVPTISTWGVVVLTLGMLGVATLAVRRGVATPSPRPGVSPE